VSVRLLPVGFFFLLLGAPPVLAGVDPAGEPCWKIEDDALRLACYDRHARIEAKEVVDPRLSYWQDHYPAREGTV